MSLSAFPALFLRVRYSKKEGAIIWLGISCPEKEQEEIICLLRANIDKTILQDAFVFSYECLRKYEGQWHLERLPLFAGYVFLESDMPKKLIASIESQPHICARLNLEASPMVLSQEEEELLAHLCGPEHHLAMSRGFIREGVTYVTEGPLKGQERIIRKIDRHKRLARLDAGVSRDGKGIQVGLEIISKS